MLCSACGGTGHRKSQTACPRYAEYCEARAKKKRAAGGAAGTPAEPKKPKTAATAAAPPPPVVGAGQQNGDGDHISI